MEECDNNRIDWSLFRVSDECELKLIPMGTIAVVSGRTLSGRRHVVFHTQINASMHGAIVGPWGFTVGSSVVCPYTEEIQFWQIMPSVRSRAVVTIFDCVINQSYSKLYLPYFHVSGPGPRLLTKLVACHQVWFSGPAGVHWETMLCRAQLRTKSVAWAG